MRRLWPWIWMAAWSCSGSVDPNLDDQADAAAPADLGDASNGFADSGGGDAGLENDGGTGAFDGGSVCGTCQAAGAQCDPGLGQCVCPNGGPVCAGSEQACEAGACVDRPAPRCTAGTRYAPGSAAFRDRTEEAGLLGVEGVRLSVIHLDDDDAPDLFVRRGATRSDRFGPEGARHSWVLRNRGDGSFEDVTESSGLRAKRSGAGGHPGEVVAAADVDNDGDVDVFVGIDDTLGDPEGQSNELYLNQGDGRFELVPAQSAIRREGSVDGVSSASFVDLDRNGRIDLFMGRNSNGASIQSDLLYENLGGGFFVESAERLGLATEPFANPADINDARAHSRAWSVNACDLDGDGNPDLLAASYGRAPNHLWLAERSEGGGPFLPKPLHRLGLRVR